MGGLEELFGGSDTAPLLSRDQNKFQTNLFRAVNPSIGKDTPTYQGQTWVGANPMMNNAAGAYAGAASINPNVQGAINQQLSGAGDPAGVRAMYEAALAPAKTAFQDQLNQVGARYGDVWGRSGAQPMMAGRATAEYGNNLANLLANLTYSDQQAGMQRQAGAIPMAANVRNSNLQALDSVYGMGSAQRAVQMQQLLGEKSGWDAKQWWNNPAIALGNTQMGIQKDAYVTDPGTLSQVSNAGQGLANMGLSFIGK